LHPQARYFRALRVKETQLDLPGRVIQDYIIGKWQYLVRTIGKNKARGVLKVVE